MIEVKREATTDPLIDTRKKQAKACTALRVHILAVGVKHDGKTSRGDLGKTTATLKLLDVVKREVSRKKQKRYLCSRTNRYFDTAGECEKHCKTSKKSPPKRNTPGSDFKSGAAGGCAPVGRVSLVCRVFRSYLVTIKSTALQWFPEVDADDAKVVKDWNAKIVAHEQKHANDIERAARRLLPEEMRYEIEGSDDDDADELLESEIRADTARLVAILNAKITIDESRLHTAIGADLEYPALCPQ